MFYKHTLVILFSLFMTNVYSQQNAPDNCVEITRETFTQLRTNNPDIAIRTILENGQPCNKKEYDSIRALSKRYNLKQVIYHDTLANSIVLVNKVLSEAEMNERDKLRDTQMKEEEQERKQLDGTVLKELTLVDMDNNTHTLESLKGKVVVLDFWFMHCKSCIEGFPDLNALKKKFKGEPVEFFAITFDDKAAVETFLKTHELDFTIIPNARPVIDQFKVSYYPYNVIIDQNGNMEFIENIMLLDVYNNLKRKIKKLL
ncbi:peroxiredoxin [Mangrovimonas sp. DI 80]|uniref:peroxiredoxin family protein n=1 Tax=Mangrovimonas sp. DI 80 TaxID=1779330 RepID=UPI0009756AA7|nr:TlpA disulfide reductase family protein [Mangrovimonas sp. DI 80]OMP32351.1 hypothetical protein BKM32_04680 [Mangrovimonas sp. DI 80]